MPFFQIQLETVDFQVSYVGLLEGMITRETHRTMLFYMVPITCLLTKLDTINKLLFLLDACRHGIRFLAMHPGHGHQERSVRSVVLVAFCHLRHYYSWQRCCWSHHYYCLGLKVCNADGWRPSISRWFDPTKVPQASCRKGSCGHQGRVFFWWSKWLEIMTDWNWENDRMCVCVFLFFHLFELGMIFHVVFFRMVFVVYLFPNMILHNSYKRLQVYTSFWNTICEHEAICENLKKAQAARKPRPSHRLYWFCKSLKLISAKKQNIYNTVL